MSSDDTEAHHVNLIVPKTLMTHHAKLIVPKTLMTHHAMYVSQLQ
jgi:hypothetical protein